MYYIEFVYLNIITTPAIQYPICVENSRYTERYAGGLCLSNCRKWDGFQFFTGKVPDDLHRNLVMLSSSSPRF